MEKSWNFVSPEKWEPWLTITPIGKSGSAPGLSFTPAICVDTDS